MELINKCEKELESIFKEIDNNTLNALRTTYKTGEPVVINEYSHNSRQLIDDGQMKYPLSPLNVLKNFTIRYNKDAHEMGY